MKKDPNRYCVAFRQVLFWAIVHDSIAHPFMALTLYSKWSQRFHDYTSRKAWIRNEKTEKKPRN